jgi:hypothetical protein
MMTRMTKEARMTTSKTKINQLAEEAAAIAIDVFGLDEDNAADKSKITEQETIRHSEPHYPGNPCSPSCEGYAPTKAAKKEAARLRRNKAARDRHAAYTSCGMKRTPYGYE